jgi:integrase/recombinase XerD
MINRYSASMMIRQDVATSGLRKPIYFRAYVNKKRVMISTYVSVPVENWDTDGQRVTYVSRGKLTKLEVSECNVILDSIENRGQKLFIRFQISGHYLSAEEFKHYMQTGSGHSDFHEFVGRYLLDYERTVSRNTMKNMNRAVTLFKGFKKEANVYELNLDLVSRFEGYLKSLGQGANTRAKQHRCMRQLMLKAVEKYGIKNPYNGFKIPKADTERDYLLKREVKELIQLHRKKELNDSLQLVLGKYLFCCHCGGLRISDVHRVGWEDVVNGMLVFVPEKTKSMNKTVKIPFDDSYREWIQHQEGDRFYDVQADQYINRCLKEISKKLGWKKRVTFHTARHTFATSYLESGGSIEVLQKILRHGKIETTQIYVHISNERIMREAENMKMFD